MGALDSAAPKAVAGVCAALAISISCYQIIQHLRCYTAPVFQRLIIRLLFLVPVYATASFLCLLAPGKAVWFNTIQDCYEGFLIYNFLALCLAYVGGPGAVEVKMNGYVLMPSWTYSTCCLPPLPVNGQFVRVCKQGALQFVLLKPVLAILTLVLYTQGMYEEGDWAANNGYLWITIVYNVTYSLALYALLLFYLGTHDLLAPYNPMLKFLVVKSVVFMTFWQSLFIAILTSVGVIERDENENSQHEGKRLQALLIVLEMLPAAIGMLWAFPHTDYKGTGANTGLDFHNVSHAISVRDLVSDTVHQFAPTYGNYVLYSNSGAAKGAPKVVKAKPPVVVKGVELGTPGYNYRDNANLLANMELGVHREEYERERAALEGRDVPEAAEASDGEAEGQASRRERTFTDNDDVFQEGPLEENDEGMEYSSAAVRMRETEDSDVDSSGDGKSGKRKKKKVLMRQTTDDFAAVDTTLQMEDDTLQPAKSAEERRKEFLARGWSDVALDEEDRHQSKR